MNQVYLSDTPRLFTALAEWCACLVFILNRPLRISGLRLWGMLGLGLAVQCLFLCLTDGLHIALWLPCMMGAVGLMFALIAACCSVPLTTVGYFTACAFLTAEFAASLEWQLWSYTQHTLNLPQDTWSTTALSLVFLAAVYALVFAAMRRLTSRREDPPAAFAFRMEELWPPVVISIACFLMSNLSFVSSNTPFSSSVLESIYNIRTLMDLAGVAMLYAYHVQRCELYMQRELDAIQNILQNQYIQYKQSRESIDVVNRKYHDLKHQIAVLRAEQDPQRRLDFLDGMEEEIRTYEAQNKTGNSVLDTLLTGKSLYCARHGVELTCVADGAQLPPPRRGAHLRGRRSSAGLYGCDGHLLHFRQHSGQRHRVCADPSGQAEAADPPGGLRQKGFSGHPVRELLRETAGVPGRPARVHQGGWRVSRLRRQVHPLCR